MNPRILATKVIHQVVHEHHSLTSALNAQKSDSLEHLSFVQELSYGVTRWYAQLDALAKQFLRKPLKTKDLDLYLLILIGLYELKQGVKPHHAIVSETVQSTLALNKQWAKGLVNAVLRGFIREQAHCLEAIKEDPVSHYAHPGWLIKRIQSAWPKQAFDILDANNQPGPLTLRVNRQKVSRDDYGQMLQNAGFAYQATSFSPDGIILERPCQVERLPGFTEGLVSVQDQAAQLAANLLAPEPGDNILDACAAPGGKTLHILEIEPSLSHLLALDKDAQRLERIKSNSQRIGLNVDTIAADAGQPADWWDGRCFERILLDAPCSATGVIRRHPDIKWLRRPKDMVALNQCQGALLEALWPLLSPGGTLLYCTCSILPEENSEVIERFVSQEPAAREQRICADWGIPQPFGRQILPEQNMDGFYYALLKKDH